jgi:hypothetical protein
MSDHVDGVMCALARRKTQSKQILYFAMKLAQQKRSNNYAEVTPTTGVIFLEARIVDPFQKLRLFRTWDKVMNRNPEHDTFYST